MLTPMDIDNQQFSRQFKGYDVDEVDDFLEEISKDYEKLMLNAKDQEDKIFNLLKQIEELKQKDNLLQDTLLIAKQSAEDMKKIAKEEADRIIAQANEIYAQKTGNIDEQIEEKQTILENLKKEISIYKEKQEALLVTQLEILKNID